MYEAIRASLVKTATSNELKLKARWERVMRNQADQYALAHDKSVIGDVKINDYVNRDLWDKIQQRHNISNMDVAKSVAQMDRAKYKIPGVAKKVDQGEYAAYLRNKAQKDVSSILARNDIRATNQGNYITRQLETKSKGINDPSRKGIKDLADKMKAAAKNPHYRQEQMQRDLAHKGKLGLGIAAGLGAVGLGGYALYNHYNK